MAESSEEKSNYKSDTVYYTRFNENFDWKAIDVISEPITDQNNNIMNSWNPKIAVENDKIYVVWQDMNNTYGSGDADWDVFFKYFDGNIWSQVQVLSEPIEGYNFNTGQSVDPDIAVENGKIYVVWKDDNNTNGAGIDEDIFFTCNITGTGWEDVQVVSEPILGIDFNIEICFKPSIEVENNKIYIAWGDVNVTNAAGIDSDIFYRCNLTGLSWEDIQVISEPIIGNNNNIGLSWNQDIEVENNKIYVVWEDSNNTAGSGIDSDIFYRSNLTGSKWENIQVISEPIPGINQNDEGTGLPSLAVEDGYIYVVWVDNNLTNGAGSDTDIFYRCNLSGVGWETVQIISEPVFGQNTNIKTSLFPEIAVENGRIFVVWQDANNTYGAGTEYDIFYKCNLTGFNWEKVEVISEPLKGYDICTGPSWRPHIAINLSESHVVWFDYNDTNNAGTDEDIFYKCKKYMPIVLSYPSVTPKSGNTSTSFNFTVTYSHFNNKIPTGIAVNISGDNYSMFEGDPSDNNYVDGKSYYFNIANLNIGSHTFKFYVSDGLSPKFTELFDGPYVYNTGPNITTSNKLIAFEDELYEVDYEYEDIDVLNIGQLAFWKYLSNSTWLKFNNTTGVLNGTPKYEDCGKYWVNITINDTIDFDYTNFTLTVININDAPIIITSNIETAIEDELFEVNYEAFDEESSQDDLEWSMNSNASWLNFDPLSALLHGIPTNNDVGKYWVEIIVNDSISIDLTNFTLTVINVNDPPEIVTDGILTAPTGKLYLVDYNATDIDSPLSHQIWSLKTNASSWLIIDSNTGIINGMPLFNDLGWYNVNVSVNDSDGGADWHEFILTVVLGNIPPKIITLDIESAIVNEFYNVDYEATDVDSPLDKLIWSLETNASWLNVEKNTGVLSGIPSQEYIGIYWVNITVTDDNGAFDFHNFTLQVYLTSNQPPKITTEDLLIAIVDNFYSVDYNATDDRTPIDKLQWYIKTNASWLDLDPVTGILIGIPTINDAGWYWVNISVFDGEDGWDFDDFVLTVLTEPIEGNNALELSNPTLSPSEGNVETEFTFSIHYYDADYDEPVYIQVVIDRIPHRMEFKSGLNVSNGNYEFRVKLSEGPHIYYFIASDGFEIVRTGNFTTPVIEKGADENAMSGAFQEWLAWIIVIIIIVILLLVFLLILQKKKKTKKEQKEEEQIGFLEEMPMIIPKLESPKVKTPLQSIVRPSLATQPIAPQQAMMPMPNIDKPLLPAPKLIEKEEELEE